MKLRRICVAFTLPVLLAMSAPLYAGEGEDRQSIEKLLKDNFEKPALPLRVTPISFSENYAVAGWTQGERGGRALLKKEKGAWVLQACGGDGLKQVAVLQNSGLTRDGAVRLVSEIEQAERRIPSSDVEKFSRFEQSME